MYYHHFCRVVTNASLPSVQLTSSGFQLSLKLLNTATIKKYILTNKFFLFPKLSLQDFQSTFYLPWWFQQRLRTINYFQALSWSLSVTSFPGSYEAM